MPVNGNMKALWHSFGCLCIAFLMLYPYSAEASPWIETDDALLRVSLQQLSDAGYLQGNIQYYPLPWYTIARDLRQIDVAKLSSEGLYAYLRVSAALDFAQRESSIALRIDANSAAEDGQTKHNSFGDAQYSEGKASISYSRTGEHVAVRVRHNARTGSVMGKPMAFDGSFVATTFGNWALSIDQLSNWWGPAHDNALVMSNNSYPIQALRINRLSDEAPAELKWLGRWSLTAFLGRTQNSADLGDMAVGGARLTWRPLSNLSFGVSNVTHFDGLDDRYNQIIGLDARAALTSQLSIYTEVAFNQFDAEADARTIGTEYRFINGDWFQQVFVEHSEIPKNFYSSSSIFGAPLEAQGFRRWQQSIGAGQDQDVSSVVLGYSLQNGAGYGLQLRLRYAEYGQTNQRVKLHFRDELTKDVRSGQLTVQVQIPVGDQLIRMGSSMERARIYPDLESKSGFFKNSLDFSLGWELRY